MQDHADIIDELETISDDLQQAVGRIRQLEGTTTGILSDRLAQVRAQVESAISNDNEWLGQSAYNLSALIDQVRTDQHTDDEHDHELSEGRCIIAGCAYRDEVL